MRKISLRIAISFDPPGSTKRAVSLGGRRCRFGEASVAMLGNSDAKYAASDLGIVAVAKMMRASGFARTSATIAAVSAMKPWSNRVSASSTTRLCTLRSEHGVRWFASHSSRSRLGVATSTSGDSGAPECAGADTSVASAAYALRRP